ncbi:MAG: pyrroloquinoline quinone biosynthesis protein C [Rhodocyclales bacterium]|nr:pyrroloquinoline quinone biosynthesis protein C [Rhodocyclales bacterium]
MSATTPWTHDEFEAQLREKGAAYHIYHPFNVMLNSGKASPEQIRGWVANRFYYQIIIPQKDAAIMSNCPDREMRRDWIQRIIDHDGRDDDAGGIEAWIRLGEAVRLANWPEHYPWIETEGLQYFRNRVTQARRDVEQGLAVTLNYFNTRPLQERALEILKFKLDILWTMNDAMMLHYGLAGGSKDFSA